MTTLEFEQLLADAGAPCISVIVPVHRITPHRDKEVGALVNAVNLAKNLLKNSNSNISCDEDSLIQKIDEIVENIDFVHTLNGIGIFVSPRVSKIINFPFNVIEKVKVGDVFESRDLLYYLNTIIDYTVIKISRNHINVFSGKGEGLSEINNEDFPLYYEETYEYSKPTIGTSFGNSSLKGFERDKSELEEIRLMDFFRKADQVLQKYINVQTPIIVAGGKKEIADYLKVTLFEKQIIGKVTGNYGNNGGLQLAKLSWKSVKDYLNSQNQIHLSNLRELFGKELVAVGIEDVWKQANEGKGSELFLQKDYECAAFISKDGYDLKLIRPLAKKKYIYTGDAVEKLISTVRKKSGKVVFLEDDELKDFDNIALQLRYNNNLA